MILYLFDLDGTLLHAYGSGREAFDAVFAMQHGLRDACAGISFGGKTDPAIVAEIFAARLGRSPVAAELAAFLRSYRGLLAAHLDVHGVDAIGGAAEALAFLATRPDVLLGVATGNVREGADAKLERAGLAGHFLDHAIGGYGSDSHIRAELVAAAIERARLAHGALREVVVVGDTIHDIAAARACNATACAVSTGAADAAALRDADVVFRSLAELPAWHAARFDS